MILSGLYFCFQAQRAQVVKTLEIVAVKTGNQRILQLMPGGLAKKVMILHKANKGSCSFFIIASSLSPSHIFRWHDPIQTQINDHLAAMMSLVIIYQIHELELAHTLCAHVFKVYRIG